MTIPPNQRSRKPLTLQHTLGVLGILLAVMLFVFFIAISIGTVDIPLSTVVRALTGGSVPETERTILLEIRLPRVLMGLVVGAGLSLAGAVFQALLRNPLAEPYILGISSGGTVGAILAIGFALGAIAVPVASFTGSALVMLLVYSLAHRHGQLDTDTLLLAGVMVGAFFNAAILLIVAVFNQELRNAFLWLMGNLATATMDSFLVVAPIVLLSSLVLFFHARNYNLISTGDEAATQLGVEVRTVKRLSYVVASLITGAVVSVSGVVGFVGLIIPHICRMVFGPDHRLLLPASALLGAAFLVLMDILARTLIAPAEIPVGAITAALGAPLFVYLLRRT